jgi:hypothetical protein
MLSARVRVMSHDPARWRAMACDGVRRVAMVRVGGNAVLKFADEVPNTSWIPRTVCRILRP